MDIKDSFPSDKMEQIPVSDRHGERGTLFWAAPDGCFRYRCRLRPSDTVDRLYLWGTPPLRLGIPAPDGSDGMLTLAGSLPPGTLEKAGISLPPRAFCAANAADAALLGMDRPAAEPVLRQLLERAGSRLAIRREADGFCIEERWQPGEAVTLAALFPLLQAVPGKLCLRVGASGWPDYSIPQNGREEKR